VRECSICGSSRIRDLPFGYSFRNTWLGALRCPSCGIIYLDPQPTADELQALYTRDYFEADYRCGHEGSSFDDSTHTTLVDSGLLERIREVKPAGRFLEIGCASGVFLHAAHTQGYQVLGIEYSSDAAQFAREKFQLDVRVGDVARAGLSNASFEIVYLGDVIEHLPNPKRTLSEIHRILVDRGLLVLACPTQTNTLFSRIGFTGYSLLGKTAEVNLPPYHLFEYRPGSMRYLLEACGFSLLRSRSTILPPSKIALRGSAVQRAAKKVCQYPNYVLTHLLGVFGDRLEVFAVKRD
jgi:SAM-dependent methyltransferase